MSSADRYCCGGTGGALETERPYPCAPALCASLRTVFVALRTVSPSQDTVSDLFPLHPMLEHHFPLQPTQPHLSPFDSAVCETSGCPLARRPRLASRQQPMTSSPSWVAGDQTRSRDDGIQPQNSALLHWRGGRMRAGRLCRVGVFLVDLRAHASLPLFGFAEQVGQRQALVGVFFPCS